MGKALALGYICCVIWRNGHDRQMGGCVPTLLTSGGQLGSPFTGGVSLSWFIQESVLAYMDSLLRWSSVPWVYSVRVTVLQVLCFAVNEIAETASSEVLGGFQLKLSCSRTNQRAFCYMMNIKMILFETDYCI